MNAWRFAIFLAVALGIWAIVHGYVFWRLAGVPWVAASVPRKVLVIAAIVLWASYPLARFLGSWRMDAAVLTVEFVAANWVGVAFLLFSMFVILDAATLGGLLFSRHTPALRGCAAITALVLASVALAQGLRQPAVRNYDVRLPGLPPERNGLVVVAVSDTHLGALIGQRWMARLAARIESLNPDLVLIVGDLVDGDIGRAEPLRTEIAKLHAPLGVWAVTGNHEYYAGLDRCIRLMEESGISVLRDSHAEVIPGLVLAGVDDLTARREFHLDGKPMATALSGRPPGATILMSHSPLEAAAAAAAGAGLMISGHTHNGQIWPFRYITRLSYPLVCGRYEVGGMTVLVGRGTGTWGPRMRLWQRSEILRIRLLSPDASAIAAKNSP